MSQITFSFIVPTRQRTAQLRRLLESVKATTQDLAGVEVILVIDQDDEESIRFKYDGVDVKHVQVPTGLTMGALNMAGYRAATGQYLMLLNDDVILRSPGWDQQVRAAFRSCPDGMVLVHVNDLVFRDTLCIFPFLTREFCLLTGGICHEDYLRYRIDDHIHNIFDLISLLGHHRRIFLPDVVFEHTNVETSGSGSVHYVPDPLIHEVDTRVFHSLLEERKKVALEARRRIEGVPHSKKEWKETLDAVTDSVAIRRPEHARWLPSAKSSSGSQPRVTVGIVSADLRSPHTQKCIELVKAHTSNYELILLDNNRNPDFNHSREMNRLLSICRTDYIVLMDDDVHVGPGWLEGMLRSFTPEVGVVTPFHRDREGRISYTGIVLDPNDSGHHTAIVDTEAQLQACRTQTLCSAAMLIYMPACGHLRLDERYSKYFLDIDYGLQVWEAGFQVVCSPYTEVTHLAGATLVQGSPRSMELYEQQRLMYVKSWVDSGRIRALRDKVWPAIPEIAWIDHLSAKIDRLVERGAEIDRNEFRQEATALLRSLAAYPLLSSQVVPRARAGLGDAPLRVDDPKKGHLAFWLGLAGAQTVLYEEGYERMNIILRGFKYYAVPQGVTAFSHERMIRNGYNRSFEADSPETLKELILRYRDLPAPGHVVAVGTSASWDNEWPAERAVCSNPLVHYLANGAFEGRKPSPLFDSAYYLAQNPEVAAAGINPLAHFLESGAMQGRRPNPLFDTAWYLQQYPDVAESGMNPLEHFLEVGAARGCKPNPFFDPTYYLEQYPDAAATGMNPLMHFLEFGARVGRRPSPLFDTARYVEQNPEVAVSGINPLAHFLMKASAGGLNRRSSDGSEHNDKPGMHPVIEEMQ